MQRKEKEELSIRDPKKAWETLQELLLNDEGMTLDELDEELKECGINPEDSVKRVFELARRVSRESHSGGSVSPHVSAILSELATKYYQVDGSKGDADNSKSRPRRSGSNNHRHVVETVPAQATVQSFHRNFKEESSNDREIREGNERRLLERAARLKQKKKPARKK